MPNLRDPIPTPTASSPELKADLRKRAFAPFPTEWTAPASCASNIPTLYHGSCSGTGCTEAPASQASIDMASGLYVNYPAFTRSGVLTSSACMPPGYAPLLGFAFTSATTCPPGWTAATAFPTGAGRPPANIICCPSGYPTPTSNTLFNKWDCYTTKAIASGERLSVFATGPITTEAGTVNFWMSESFVSMTAWPVTTRALAFHPAIRLQASPSTSTRIAGVSTTGLRGGSSATVSSTVGGGGSSAGPPGFSLGGLNTGASIGVLVAIILVALAAFGGLLLLLRKKLAGARKRPESGNLTDLYVTPEQKRQSTQPTGPYSPLPAKS